jgi:hypothetical protein
MRINRLMLAACLLHLALLMRYAQGQEVVDLGVRLLAERASITSYQAKALVRRSKPDEITSSLFLACDGDTLRLDRERLRFAKNLSQEGYVTRTVLSPDGRIKYHGIPGGVSLDHTKRKDSSFVDLRFAGLNLAQFSNLDRTRYSFSNSLVQRVLANLSLTDEREVRGIQCLVATSFDDDGQSRSFFFDKATKAYRGCEFKNAKVTLICWIEESLEVHGILFPVKIHFQEFEESQSSFEEETTISELEFNGTIPSTTFEFSGLGVKPGTAVTVRNLAKDGDEITISEMYWDGSKLVESTLFVNDSFWTLSKTLGAAFILIGVIIGFTLLKVRKM